jgi:ankyrin repeat protein
MTLEILNELKRLVAADDVQAAARFLDDHQEELRSVNSTADCSIGQAFSQLRSLAMADLLLRKGITISMVSDWWAPGFGLNKLPPDVAEFLVGRGAILSPHAAAALGLTERLRQLLNRDPELAQAKGGDGCRPLHFSRNIETAGLLLDRGAELDAKDEDHDSTPAQWRIGDAPEVTRFLLDRGAHPDIFMAAALNDLSLATKLLHHDPRCTTYRIGNNSGPFPGIGVNGRGGTIYQWTLGFNQSPHEIALRRGHRALFDFLFERTAPRQQLLVACMLADRPLATRIAAEFPQTLTELEADDKALLAKCCWETNLNPAAVGLMLDLGFSIDVREHNHGYQALHNAAWCGHAGLVKLLLERGHPVNQRDPRFNATALGYALHSCLVAKRHPEGDFPRVVESLLEAGTPLDESQYPTGDQEIDGIISRYNQRR